MAGALVTAFVALAMRDFDLPSRRPIKKLSRGMTSAVGIVIGLASRAPLTLFDEPYLGLDAVARHQFYDRLLADYAEHPRTIVLSTHLIEEISDLLEHVLLLDRGRVLLDADAETLRATALTVTGKIGALDAAARTARVDLTVTAPDLTAPDADPATAAQLKVLVKAQAVVQLA